MLSGDAVHLVRGEGERGGSPFDSAGEFVCMRASGCSSWACGSEGVGDVCMKRVFRASEDNLFHCVLYVFTASQAGDVPDAPRLSTFS